MTHKRRVGVKRLHTYLTDDQHEELTYRSQVTGKTVADIIRHSLDWYLSVTSYTDETMEMLERKHPEMTPERIIEWLMFRWRLDEEGKSRKNGNDRVVAMLQEILEILKRNEHANDANHA